MKHIIILQQLLIFTLFTLTLYALPSPLVHAQTYTKEEYAVYNRCQLQSPRGVCPQPPKNSNPVLDFFLSFFFWATPQNADRLQEQAQTKQKALMPEQITKPNAEEDAAFKDTIGAQTGIYGYTMPNGLVPKINPPDNQGTKTECIANNALFPENVNIFTNTEDCPPQGKPI